MKSQSKSKGKTVTVRCRNVMGGINKMPGKVIASDATTLTVRHQVSEVEPGFVTRVYSRTTGSWMQTVGTSRCSWISKGQLRELG